MEVLFLLAMLAMGAVNAVCFLIGAKIGLAVAKGEEVNLIPVKPAEAVEVHPVQPEEDAEKKSRFEAIVQNIDNYDGTEQGQVDVPWR